MEPLRQKREYRLPPIASAATMSERAYLAIKGAILDLRFMPGDALVEDELAGQLSISKTPVRDALLSLEREGLVIKIPYKGTYVAEITEQDAIEIFQLRAVLEGLAGRLAAASFQPSHLAQAEAILDRFDQALARGDLTSASALGAEFHQFVIGGATNQRLHAFLDMLESHTRRLRSLSNRGAGRLRKSAAEHRAILAALRKGDPELVEAAFKRHHQSVLKDLRLRTPDSESAHRAVRGRLP